MFTLGLEFLFKVWFYYRSFSDFLGKAQQYIPKKQFKWRGILQPMKCLRISFLNIFVGIYVAVLCFICARNFLYLKINELKIVDLNF